MAVFLHMIIYIINQILYLTRIGDFAEEYWAVKNCWESLTEDKWFGTFKIVNMINRKDVIMDYPI